MWRCHRPGSSWSLPFSHVLTISALLSALSKYHALGVVTSYVYLFSNYSLPSVCREYSPGNTNQSWEYKGVQDRHVPPKIFLIFTDFFIQLFPHLLSSYYEPRGALVIGGTAMDRITPKLCLPEAPILVYHLGTVGRDPPPLHQGQLPSPAWGRSSG